MLGQRAAQQALGLLAAALSPADLGQQREREVRAAASYGRVAARRVAHPEAALEQRDGLVLVPAVVHGECLLEHQVGEAGEQLEALLGLPAAIV